MFSSNTALTSSCGEQPTALAIGYDVWGFCGNPLINNSKRCNPFLALEILLGCRKISNCFSYYLMTPFKSLSYTYILIWLHIYVYTYTCIVGFYMVFQMTSSVSCSSPYSLPFSPTLSWLNPSVLVSVLSLHSNTVYASFLGRSPPPSWSLTRHLSSMVIRYFKRLYLRVKENIQYLSFGVWVTLLRIVFF